MPVDDHRNPPDAATSVRGMTVRYATALGLVGLLTVVAFLALHTVISTQSSAAAEVNLSGRQRMLSQRLALDSQRFVLAVDEDREQLRQSIVANAALMAATHQGLLQGDAALGLPGQPSARMRELYRHPEYGLDPLLQVYLAAVRRVVAAQSDATTRSQALDQVLEIGPNELLQRLDAIVRRYQEESEAEVRYLSLLETGVMATTICILILEAGFIFAPMVRRVQRERAGLIRAEHNQRAVIEASQDGIVVLDLHGRITRANPAAERLFGESEADLVGRPLAEVLGAEDSGGDWGERPPIGLQTYERNGHWIECTFGILRREQGGRVMAVLRESTQRLQDHMRSLERKNRQLDQFAYAASHDLKAPLRAIANLSAWIAEDLGDQVSTESATHLQLLQDRVQRLERLISGLHAYASAGQGAQDVEEVELPELIREVLGDADPEGRFEHRIDCGIVRVQAHRPLLWQVVANLINNAVRHHGDGPGWVAVRTESTVAGFLLCVADDGPGIQAAQQERVFDIFHTLRPKDETGGLGLGLALVKRIVDDIGGEIRLHSTPGHGSRFEVHWPMGAGGPS